MNSTRTSIEVTVKGDLRRLNFDEAIVVLRELEADETEAVDAASKRAVRVGAFLLEVRRAFPHGTWDSWLSAAGINRKTAGKRARLAVVFADAMGELDDDKVMAAAVLWNESHGDDKQMAIDLTDLSVHQLEILARIRTQPGNFGPDRGHLSGVAGTGSPRASGGADGSSGASVSTGSFEEDLSWEELLALKPEGGDEDEAESMPISCVIVEERERPRGGAHTGREARATAVTQLSLAGLYQEFDLARGLASQLAGMGEDGTSEAVQLTRDYVTALQAALGRAA